MPLDIPTIEDILEDESRQQIALIRHDGSLYDYDLDEDGQLVLSFHPDAKEPGWRMDTFPLPLSVAMRIVEAARAALGVVTLEQAVAFDQRGAPVVAPTVSYEGKA